jgi:peptide chain release factor subunit 3
LISSNDWIENLFFRSRYLTGQIDIRTLEKYQNEARENSRESWSFAYALDTNKEEREKGKTVEVGRAWFETEQKHVIILDAPGHKYYVPNMISAAAQADIAILVIYFILFKIF